MQHGFSIIRRGTRRLFGLDAPPGITISTVPSLVSRWLVPRLIEFEQLDTWIGTPVASGA